MVIISVRLTKLLQTYQCTPIIELTPFKNIDLCLNRKCKCTALAILVLKFEGIAEFVHVEQRNIDPRLCKNCRQTYYKRQASQELLGVQHQLMSVLGANSR